MRYAAAPRTLRGKDENTAFPNEPGTAVRHRTGDGNSRRGAAPTPTGFVSHTLLVLLLALALTGCDQPPLANQPKYEPYEAAWDWPDDQSALPPVPGTVPRDALLGPVPETLPMPLSRELLERGRNRYRIYCTPCHGKTGYGNGLVVQHGFPAPPSYHTYELRNAPLRHFYDVISDGYGVMYSYAARVAPEDRWAIAAYIRALQLSQHAPVEALTPELRAKLEGGQ